MEQASSAIHRRQAQATREREEALRTELPTTVLARTLARLVGADLGDDTVSRLGRSFITALAPRVVRSRWG
jgi:hypothetical protein